MKIAVIGGGAAGFFAALQVKENDPDARVVLFEKTSKLLSKVRISGGGRCNVTNAQEDINVLAAAYPRGGTFMKRALWAFNTTDIRQWFEQRGVDLYAQDDGRVFPTTDDSETIAGCFLDEARQKNIEIQIKSPVRSLERKDDKIQIQVGSGDHFLDFDRVILATGGSPKAEGLQWLEALGHEIVTPVPSLFTFNMPDEKITELMGLSAPSAIVGIQGSKLTAKGPLLITHWGMSGPAILKLSAFGARELYECGYEFSVRVNWSGVAEHEEVKDQLSRIMYSRSDRSLNTLKPFDLPRRLWAFLIARAGLDGERKVAACHEREINKLVNILANDVYQVRGKTTFKEEFVTCGGIDLKSIHWKTMESKAIPGLFFAGELLDIDGITGGYNFQAAWTTAYIAAELNSTLDD